MKAYLKKRIFWEAYLIVKVSKLFNTPEWAYSYWIHRLNLIKKGEI